VRSLTMSRPRRILAASTIVFAIGLGGGGLAYAASWGSAPVLTPVHGNHAVKFTPAKPVPLNVAPKVVGSVGEGCSGLSLTPVPGAKPPKVTAAKTPVPVHAKLVVCGSGGNTSGSSSGAPVLTPVHGIHAVKLAPAKSAPLNVAPKVVGSGGKTSGR
jgi:hypothetical protein